MSMSANLHDVKKAEAWDLPNASSLRLTNGDNCSLTVFMPYDTAVAMVAAFNNPGRVKQMIDFVDDFAKADFAAIRSPGWVSPEDEMDEVTELAPIEAWQEDAANLIYPKPATDEAAE